MTRPSRLQRIMSDSPVILACTRYHRRTAVPSGANQIKNRRFVDANILSKRPWVEMGFVAGVVCGLGVCLVKSGAGVVGGCGMSGMGGGRVRIASSSSWKRQRLGLGVIVFSSVVGGSW